MDREDKTKTEVKMEKKKDERNNSVITDYISIYSAFLSAYDKALRSAVKIEKVACVSKPFGSYRGLEATWKIPT